MTLSRIGADVRRQRETLGISPKDLATEAGIAAARLDEIEEGTTPTTWELGRLAQALGTDAAVLWRGEGGASARRSTARFRAPSGVNNLPPHDARLLARLAEAGRILNYLLSQLGENTSSVARNRVVKPIATQPEPWEQGYKLGANARFAFAPQKQPILSLQACLESLGVHVAFVDFDTPDVLAASLYEPGAEPVIALNRRTSRVRLSLSRRAVMAHELCHLLHDGGESDLLTLISRQNQRESHEQRANGFAPNFVVPGGWLPLDVESPREAVLDTARQWGLSYEGATWHLKNASRITQQQAEALIADPEEISEGPFEPTVVRESAAILALDDAPTPLTLGLLSDVTIRAFRAELISRARAIEILRLT